jgi:signal transduction histidine kinase
MKGNQEILFRKGMVIIFMTIFFVLNTKGDTIAPLKWRSSPSHVNFNLQQIHFFPSQKAIANGSQILIYKNQEWTLFHDQPPVNIDILFPIDTQSFVISSNTDFQESDLYIRKNKQWQKIWNPIANVIYSLYFTDLENGAVSGLGEIALLKNGKWQMLPPPSLGVIKKIIIDQDSIIWALSLSDGLFKYHDKWLKIPNSDDVQLIRYQQASIYVIGKDYLGFIDSKDSIHVLSENSELSSTSSFSILSKNEAIVVGNQGSIMHYKNKVWASQKVPIQSNLNDICLLNDHTAWVVGDNGIVLHYSDNEEQNQEINAWKGFKKVTFNSNAKVIDDEYGVVATDINNDGLVDIFTCGLFEANHLYINNGTNDFINQAQQWKINLDESSTARELNLGACAGDIDNDGDDDIYVTVLNGKNKIYKNIRGKYFVDYSSISQAVGAQTDRSNSCIMGDVDNDGDLDIFITNENASNCLFLNNGAGIFSEATQAAHLISDGGGTACSFGDIDQDGDIDLYVSNWSTYNVLYKNLLQETGELRYSDITNDAHVAGQIYSKSNAVVFSDIDNDADLDLFVTNRKASNKLYLNNGDGIFTDKTSSLIGEDSLKSYGAVIADFDNDGFKDIYVSNVGENVLYSNMNGQQFINHTLKYGADIKGYSTGSAVADFNNDGFVDLYVANYLGESSTILFNIGNNRHVIHVQLRGMKNNSNAIGAKIFVYKENGLNQVKQLISYQEISGGSGYASMNQRFLPIAVLDQDYVDIKVVFPNGITKVLVHQNVTAHTIIEDVSGIYSYFLLSKRKVWLLFKDLHLLLKLFTWIGLILFIVVFMISGRKKFNWSRLYSLGLGAFLLLLFYVQFHYFEYEDIWFSSFLPLGSIGLLMLLIYLYYSRKVMELSALKEQEQIREKLSRDLHDDLASTVSTIAIYLTLIRYNLKNNEKKLNELLDKTSSLVSDAVSSITDLIWAINPKSESLEDLMIRVNNNFATVFHEKGISFTSSSNHNLEILGLVSKTKQNVYLIIKEALNNILKYASASEVSILIETHKQEIQILIKDNGIGFDLGKVKNKGHGLTNMHIRAEDINASIKIVSNIDKGTEIRFIFKADQN